MLYIATGILLFQFHYQYLLVSRNEVMKNTLGVIENVEIPNAERPSLVKNIEYAFCICTEIFKFITETAS